MKCRCAGRLGCRPVAQEVRHAPAELLVRRAADHHQAGEPESVDLLGELLAATGRHAYRPAHLHLIVSAPGYRPVTTHVFVAGSPYLDSDAVFGVKESLVREVVDGVLTFDVGLLRDDP